MPHRTHPSLILILLVSLLVSCGSPTILLVDPPGPVVVFEPDVPVRVAFEPPLAPDESVTALLRNRDGSVLDLSAALVISPDRRAGSVAVVAPPGSNYLDLRRGPVGPGQNRRAAIGIDRGGFLPGTEVPFGSGVMANRIEIPAAGAGTRMLDLLVWYPTHDQGVEDVLLGGLLDASVAQDARQLPTLLMSHGACGSPNYGTFLASALARRGWVVAAMSHPPSDNATPNCGSSDSLVAAFLQRTNDVSRSLDWLLSESGDPRSALYERIDANRVGVTGHSFGGQTAILAAAADPRIKGSLAMAPSYTTAAAIIDTVLPLDVPAMVMGATLDFSTPFSTDQVPLYAKLTSPRYLVELVNGGHLNFQDLCVLGPLCGQVDQATGHAILLPYALGFLGHHVAGDPRWQPLIAEGPGSLLTRDDGV